MRDLKTNLVLWAAAIRIRLREERDERKRRFLGDHPDARFRGEKIFVERDIVDAGVPPCTTWWSSTS
jgi:hypothetical protein